MGDNASTPPFVSQPNAVLSRWLCAGITCRSGCVLVISDLRCHRTAESVTLTSAFYSAFHPRLFLLIAIVFYRDLCVVL